MLRTSRYITRTLWNVSLKRNHIQRHLPSSILLTQKVHFSVDKKKTDSSNESTEKKSKFLILKSGLTTTFNALRDPRGTAKYLWALTKETAVHYWMGTKLLWSDTKTAWQILKRVLQGHSMTRRERLQLIRTTMDIFRLVPFAVFVIVPFMELLLPFALKLFPNMLPSTYQDSLKKEEQMKNELAMRLAVAGFMQDTLKAMAQVKRKSGEHSEEGASAKELIDFMEKAKLGEALPNDTVIRMARLFKDELTLANVQRPQLVTMCQFMGLQPYGADAFLRFQLRTKLKAITEDDRRILWEGIDSLTLQELREASQERGMRATGLNEYGYKRQLKEWLDLSQQKNIPISLLIMSRAFMLNPSAPSVSMNPEQSLRNSLSSLDDDLINEVVLEHARSEELNTKEMVERKIESIEFQNELIREEREDTEEAKQLLELKKKQKQSDVPSIESIINRNDIPNTESVIAESLSNVIRSKESAPVKADTVLDTAAVSASMPIKANTPLLSEIQALADMALKSSVEREKMALALMKATIEPPKVVKSVDEALLREVDMFPERGSDTHEFLDGSAGQYSAAAEENSSMINIQSSEKEDFPSNVKKTESVEELDTEDRNMDRMKYVLKSMIQKLEMHIEKTDKALGDKLQRLDLDRDGMLDSEELRGAVAGVLKRYSTPEEAQNLVTILDKDKDGKVSVDELKEYIESIRTNIEAEAHGSQLSDGTKEPI